MEAYGDFTLTEELNGEIIAQRNLSTKFQIISMNLSRYYVPISQILENNSKLEKQ